MYFHTLFHSHVFPKNTNDVTRATLPNGFSFLKPCFTLTLWLIFIFIFLNSFLTSFKWIGKDNFRVTVLSVWNLYQILSLFPIIVKTDLKKVSSLFSLVALAILHSSFDVSSLSLNEEAEIDVLLNWKASLQNETQSPLPSWTLLPNNATNSSNNQCCTYLSNQ